MLAMPRTQDGLPLSPPGSSRLQFWLLGLAARVRSTDKARLDSIPSYSFQIWQSSSSHPVILNQSRLCAHKPPSPHTHTQSIDEPEEAELMRLSASYSNKASFILVVRHQQWCLRPPVLCVQSIQIRNGFQDRKSQKVTILLSGGFTIQECPFKSPEIGD